MKKEEVENYLHQKIEKGETVSPILPEGIKNYLIDIDGTICDDVPNEEPERMVTAKLYPDALETINNWYDKGHIICFFTARIESHREVTEKWLKDNNYDWNDPKLALGYIKLGQVDLEKSFGTTKFLNIYDKMIDCLNISKITIVGSENILAEYNYSLSDPNWKDLQIKELKKGYESHSLR